MLWDPKWEKKTDLRPADLSKPSLSALAYILRHREYWPSYFRWDYMNPDRCALGLSRAVWPRAFPPGRPGYSYRHTFGIGRGTFLKIFDAFWSPWRSPETVAAKIDRAVIAND